MAIQTTFTWRNYAGETDVEAIRELFNLCEEYDKLDEGYLTTDAMRVRLNDPDLDQARGMRLWDDHSGRLVGYAQLFMPPKADGEALEGHLLFRVHPEARNVGLEQTIIDWGSATLSDEARARGVTGRIRTGVQMTTPEYIEYRKGLVEGLGFAPVRHGFKMARSLEEPLSEPVFPEGFRFRTSSGPEDYAGWLECYNASFIDHWAYHPMTMDAFLNWISSAHYSRDLDLLGIAPDGTVAGICMCRIYAEDNAHNNRSEGWIDDLGTRRGYRGIGLGRAMLLAGMHTLKDRGIRTAVLYVDAQNPTGALRLYESAGFTVVRTGVTYEKEL